MLLANIGITERAEQLMQSNPANAADLLSATERLIGNDQMGKLFKALAFAPTSVSDIAGFPG
jgi:SAM-dependent MidA family methyltransferase